MIKQLLTAASFAAGGAGVVLVAHLSRTSLAFTSPARDQTVLVSPSLLVVDEPLTIETESTLVPRQVATAAAPKSHRPEKAPPSVPAPALVPCSDWTEVGAMFVAPAGATGVRSVRGLCDQATPR